jgi:hypothetical protein
MPLSGAATHAERKATFKLLSGFDSAGKSGLFRGEAEARLKGPFGLRVGASYDGIGDAKTRPFVGGYLDVLKQGQHGINLSLHGRFESASFNVVPGVAAGFGLSRNFGGSLLLFSAEYGQGLQSDERTTEVGATAYAVLARRFSLLVPRGHVVGRGRDRGQHLAVHLGDEADADALGARGLALAVAGAVTEAFSVHLGRHLAGTIRALRLALR